MKTKVLIYCTMAKPYLFKQFGMLNETTNELIKMSFHEILNGKIVAECEVECEKIFQLVSWNVRDGIDYDTYSFKTNTLNAEELLNKSCINKDDLERYLIDYPQYLVEQPVGYALHISNLIIFDKPMRVMKLSEVQRNNACRECPFDCMACGSDDCKLYSGVRQAPQNMMWVWIEDTKYCLISIRPEWVAKILNGEKTIEVRKKILKGMYEETL